MIFSELPLAGAWLIDIERLDDPRGFFARTVCVEEFEKQGLSANFVQQSISFNCLRGTLRGLHYQIPPYEEDKLVRVTHGSIFDVIVDIRPESPTYGKWYGVELSEQNRRQLYIPQGFAHGFQTLQDKTEVLYQMTTSFKPNASRGIRWDDPTLGINWPLPVNVIDPAKLSIADTNLPFWLPHEG